MAWLTDLITAIVTGITTLLSGLGSGTVALFNALFVDATGTIVTATYLAYGMVVGLVIVIGLACVRFVSRIFSR